MEDQRTAGVRESGRIQSKKHDRCQARLLTGHALAGVGDTELSRRELEAARTVFRKTGLTARETEVLRLGLRPHRCGSNSPEAYEGATPWRTEADVRREREEWPLQWTRH